MWVQGLGAVAQNCMYGSTLSPPRLDQVRDAVREYFENATVSDENFQFWLPYLAKSLKLKADISAEGADEVFT